MSEPADNRDLVRHEQEPEPARRESDFAEAHDPLMGGPPPPSAEPVVVPRWLQLVAVPLAALALYAVAKAAGVVVLLFLTAAVIALILNPAVALVQRVRVPRGLAILVVYLGFFVVLGAAGLLLANPVSQQVSAFRDDVPSIVDSANDSLADVQAYFDRKGIDLQVKQPGRSALGTLRDRVVGGTGQIVSFGTDLVTRVFTAGFGLILVFVLSIYMLVYGERIGEIARAVMPPGDGSREDDYPSRVSRAVAGYVRGQLLFSLAMGAGAGIGLYVFGLVGIFPDGKTYALAFGVFFGLMELIPYVGPFLGAAPPVLVALFQDPLTGVWVALLFVGLQQIEGHVVAPLVFGHALRINPLLVIFALLFGGELYGILGALVALPIAAVLRETVVYLRQHLVLEPWGTMSPLAVAASRRGPPPDRPCAECGRPVAAADAYCRACGAAVERPPIATGR
jgi:predicted PurR-regulated permease PerM